MVTTINSIFAFYTQNRNARSQNKVKLRVYTHEFALSSGQEYQEYHMA
jgi:hypothetical protein